MNRINPSSEKIFQIKKPQNKHVVGILYIKKIKAQKKQPFGCSLPGNVLLSQDPSVQVPSALEGLTVVFGMGTRVSPPLSPPDIQDVNVGVVTRCDVLSRRTTSCYLYISLRAYTLKTSSKVTLLVKPSTD